MIAINNDAGFPPEDDDDGKGKDGDGKSKDRKSRTRGQRKLGRGKKCADLTVDDAPILRSAMAKGFRLSSVVRRRMAGLAKMLSENDDATVRLEGAKLVLEMEKVNVAVDRNRIAEEKTTDHKHLHLHQGNSVQIVHVDDWYGSKAANLAAPDDPPTTDPARG
jgi:hypothetical protein